MIDSLRLTSHENRRKKNERLPDYLEALDSKIKRGLIILEEEVLSFSSVTPNPLDLGVISVATLIGTIKRNSQSKYNIPRKNIDKWFERIELRKSLIETRPPSL